MKKIALTSLMAMFAVSGAHALALNTIDGNPLYRPKAGHFYSETGLASSTHDADTVTASEYLGYGITDRLSVEIGTVITQKDWFNKASWDNIDLSLNYRVADYQHWKADIFGGYSVSGVLPAADGFFHGSFMNEKNTFYTWVAGARGGYTNYIFTIAGHAYMSYINKESFNWKQNAWTEDEIYGVHVLTAGVDAQLVLNKRWNLVSGADYSKILDHYNDPDTMGQWDLTFGANFNIDKTKFVGAYITKEIKHVPTTDSKGNWDVQNGFGMEVKFGIDF